MPLVTRREVLLDPALVESVAVIPVVLAVEVIVVNAPVLAVVAPMVPFIAPFTAP